MWMQINIFSVEIGFKIKFNHFDSNDFPEFILKKQASDAQESLFLNKSKPDDKKNHINYFLLVFADAFFSKNRSYLL
jgi:hypothetical protein